MQTKLISLKRDNRRIFIADEKFWNNVKYMIFHSAHLEIRLKRGRSTNYLHNWIYERLIEQSNQAEQEDFYKRIGCSYRFPKENDEFLDYLYKEAIKRGLIVFEGN